MAAGEDETKPVVLHGAYLLGDALSTTARGEHRGLAEQFPPARLAAQVVDRTVPSGRRDPSARVGRQAVRRPLAQRDGEGLLNRILGDVDVAENPDQSGHRAPGLLAEDPADVSLAELVCGVDVAHRVRPKSPGKDGLQSAP